LLLFFVVSAVATAAVPAAANGAGRLFLKLVAGREFHPNGFLPVRVALAENRKGDGFPFGFFLDGGNQILRLLDRFSVHGRDQISQNERPRGILRRRFQSRHDGGTVGNDLRDQTPVERSTELPFDVTHEVPVDDVDPYRGTDDFPVLDDLVDDSSDRVDGNREPDADVTGLSTVRRVNHRVDTDETTPTVEQGPTGISGIDRRVGLDAPVDGTAADPLDVSPESGHDTFRQGVI